MKEYRFTVNEKKEVIHAEEMSPEQLYQKLMKGFDQLYIPVHKESVSIMSKRS